MIKRIIIAFLLLTAVALPAKEKQDFSGNVKVHQRDGSHVIENIPQVSQKKAFCAPASVSMVLRYYDTKINQKKLAKLFETTKEGTRPDAILDVLGKGDFSDFQPKVVYVLTVTEFNQTINAALANSKLKKKSRKKLERGTSSQAVNEVFALISKDVALESVFPARQDCSAKLKEAFAEYIDKGLPLLWSVFMCYDPEEQSDSGHMRLLVGYVKNGDEITHVIYRDPWGGKTKFKRMTFEEAVIMTHGVFAIIPE